MNNHVVDCGFRHFNSLILDKWVEKVVPLAHIELGLKYSIFSQIVVPGLLSHGPQHTSHAGVLDHFSWSILDAVQLSNSLNMGVKLRQKNIHLSASRPSHMFDFIKFWACTYSQVRVSPPISPIWASTWAWGHLCLMQ